MHAGDGGSLPLAEDVQVGAENIKVVTILEKISMVINNQCDFMWKLIDFDKQN